MSHFTVAVVAKDQNELERRLQPFHEYESTGVQDEYVKWVVEVPADEIVERARDIMSDDYVQSRDKLRVKYEKHFASEDYAQIIEDWDGLHETDAQGNIGRFTNPNAKWDWWIVGGRWTGALRAIGSPTGGAIVGRPGLMTKPAEANRYDSLLVRDIDFDSLDVEWDGYDGEDHWRTYAFIDRDGNWVDRGDMGWWGIQLTENDGYPEAFQAFIKDLKPDERIWIVDCHI